METRKDEKRESRFNLETLEQRIAPTQSAYPPGQFPSGNPAEHQGAGNAPGESWKGN